MAKKIDSFTISIFLLAVSAVIVFRLSRVQELLTSADIKPELPVRVGAWALEKEVTIPEVFLNILGTRAASLGEYAREDSAERFQLYLLRSAARRSSFHQPEYCYLGSGKNELLKKGVFPVSAGGAKTISVPYMLVQTERGFQLVAYFFTINAKIIPSYYAQQFEFLKKRLKNEKFEGMLVRIAKPSKGAEFSSELDSLAKIITDFVTINYNEL